MTAGAGARATAARIVAAVRQDGQSLDRAIDEPALLVDDDRSSAALVRLLAYESLRWYVRLDALLARFIKPSQVIEPQIRALGIVGLAQLFHTDIPAYAAVSATVEATRLLRQPKAAGLINAVLRRAQREGGALLKQIDTSPGRRTAHPEWFVAQLRKDWPHAWESILDANNAHPPFWVRVNRGRTTRDVYRERLGAAGLASETSPHAPDALMLAHAVDPRDLPGFTEGEVSVQDAAAQLSVEFIAPEAGERVLDACAAPGGKTCHLLEREPGLREVVAVDSSASRLERVRDNLARSSRQATLIVGDAAKPTSWWDGVAFDRILLDVPCSATGVIRRHPDIKLLRRSSDIAALAERQLALLDAAWGMLRPGGTLVYASCSAFRAENANVVGAFLRQVRALDLTTQRATALGLRTHEGIGHAIAAGTANMDGFYYACLQKPEAN